MSSKQTTDKTTNSTVKMTKTAASRIQSATAKNTGGSVGKGSFAARAQKAANKS